ncbi:MAG: Fumarate reductase flavoprotein subunit [Syntrophus sp. SKADARSKE-3]|nr:Fumarate reductase flavoprotein subunit [Syntrophus sp. SKADARSKE-3]
MPDATNEMSRRGFMKVAAAGAGALAAAGIGVKDVDAAPIPKKWDMEADVVIAGFGGAGACAAIEAAKAGASVLLFDKSEVPGGSTRLSGGIIYAAGTKTQKDAGLADNSEAMYKYIMACGRGGAKPELVKLASEMSNENIEWIRAMGAEFPVELLAMSGMEFLPEYTAVTPATKRGHRVKGGGRALFRVMAEAVKAQKNVKTVLGAQVVRPIVRPAKGNGDFEVIGVKILRRGREMNVRAKKAVVLATGGIVSSPGCIPWLRDYSPDLADTVPTGDINATGDGYRIGIYCGGAMKGLNTICSLPSAMFPGQKMASIVYANIWGIPNIYVRKDGKRFVDEGTYYVLVCEAMIEKKATTSFCIMDATSVKRALEIAESGKAKGISPEMTIAIGLDPRNLDKQAQSGDLWRADTVAELARQMNLDPSAVEKTVAFYNRDAEAGRDSEFGRKKALAPLKKPPFYGFKVNVGMIAHDGGLDINTKSQVLNSFGEIIPRLYAAGRDAIGVFGGRYPGSGTAISDLLTFGRVAGRFAAAEKSWK